MSAEVNAVLTAKDVEGLRERVKRIQALSKGGRENDRAAMSYIVNLKPNFKLL